MKARPQFRAAPAVFHIQGVAAKSPRRPFVTPPGADAARGALIPLKQIVDSRRHRLLKFRNDVGRRHHSMRLHRLPLKKYRFLTPTAP
jgi:hypothetical protein